MANIRDCGCTPVGSPWVMGRPWILDAWRARGDTEIRSRMKYGRGSGSTVSSPPLPVSLSPSLPVSIAYHPRPAIHHESGQRHHTRFGHDCWGRLGHSPWPQDVEPRPRTGGGNPWCHDGITTRWYHGTTRGVGSTCTYMAESRPRIGTRRHGGKHTHTHI